MIKLLLFFMPIIYSGKNDTCTSAIINYIFKPNYNTDWTYLCIPVDINSRKGRIIIEKDDFVKYMLAFDSSFKDEEKLKKYIKEFLAGERIFYFYDIVYTEKVKSNGYVILYEKNKILDFANRNKESFLQKYLEFYNPKETHFNFDTGTPPTDFYFAIETLFKMNYLTTRSDGSINVTKVLCK